jgi:nucleotide-binding universal stress UspA family protein
MLTPPRGRLLLQLAKTTAERDHNITAELLLRHGTLVDTLTSLEAEVRLFVLGKRGEHADFAKGHLGSQLERVVRAVHRPLLVASRAYADIQHVLIAFDGSATTRKGVEMIAASPLFNGLAIRVVMVGAETEANRAALRWALEALSAAGLAAKGEVLPGAPEAIIGDCARDPATLLVMGAYGHSRIRQLIVGSTTTALLRTCRVAVLLLR